MILLAGLFILLGALKRSVAVSSPLQAELKAMCFKDPELKKPWSGVLRTIACRNNCIYNSSVTPVQMSYDELSEDCLYMKCCFSSTFCLRFLTILDRLKRTGHRLLIATVASLF